MPPNGSNCPKEQWDGATTTMTMTATTTTTKTTTMMSPCSPLQPLCSLKIKIILSAIKLCPNSDFLHHRRSIDNFVTLSCVISPSCLKIRISCETTQHVITNGIPRIHKKVAKLYFLLYHNGERCNKNYGFDGCTKNGSKLVMCDKF